METLKQNQPLEFPLESDVPEEIVTLVRQCCDIRAEERPDFQSIMATLIHVAEGLPSLNGPVSRLIQTHGGNRALLVRTKESIVRFQIETIDKKIDRVQLKEAQLQEQMRALEDNITQLRSRRQHYLSERGKLNLRDG